MLKLTALSLQLSGKALIRTGNFLLPFWELWELVNDSHHSCKFSRQAEGFMNISVKDSSSFLMCVTRKKDTNSFQLSIIADSLVLKLKSALLNASVLTTECSQNWYSSTQTL